MVSRARVFMGLMLLAGGATSALLACSDDDNNNGPTTQDAGRDTGTSETGSSCPPVEAPTCTSATCAAQFGGDAGFCIEGQCVPAITDDCKRAGGDITGDNQIIVGALLGVTGTGPTRVNSLEIAIDEINAAGGVPDPDQCKPARKLAFVHCDDTNAGDAGLATDRVRGGNHLLKDLRTPVIVGSSTSGITLDVATNLTVPNRAMQFAPSSTAISITDFAASPDGTRLLWRAAPSDVGQSSALQKVFAQVETIVNKGAAVKVALVTKSDAYGAGIATAFRNGLLINGAPATTQVTAISYDTTPAGATAPNASISNALAALKTAAPDIIVMAGTTELTQFILVPYENERPGGNPLPYYVLADGQKKDDLVADFNVVTTTAGYAAINGDKASLHNRIRGTQPGVVTQQLTQNFFNFSYKNRYPTNAVLSYGMAGTYDIGYMIAYAAAAAKGQPLTGTVLAQNMQFLVGGTEEVDVGSAALARGMTAMLGGQKVDFNGASGPLDFDLAKGEAPSDYSVWCVKNDPNNAGKFTFQEVAGTSYSARTQTLSGNYDCP